MHLVHLPRHHHLVLIVLIPLRVQPLLLLQLRLLCQVEATVYSIRSLARLLSSLRPSLSNLVGLTRSQGLIQLQIRPRQHLTPLERSLRLVLQLVVLMHLAHSLLLTLQLVVLMHSARRLLLNLQLVVLTPLVRKATHRVLLPLSLINPRSHKEALLHSVHLLLLLQCRLLKQPHLHQPQLLHQLLPLPHQKFPDSQHSMILL